MGHEQCCASGNPNSAKRPRRGHSGCGTAPRRICSSSGRQSQARCKRLDALLDRDQHTYRTSQWHLGVRHLVCASQMHSQQVRAIWPPRLKEVRHTPTDLQAHAHRRRTRRAPWFRLPRSGSGSGSGSVVVPLELRSQIRSSYNRMFYRPLDRCVSPDSVQVSCCLGLIVLVVLVTICG